LVLREILTRYGRHGLGFLWLFLEPMLFSGGVIAVWQIFHAGRASFALAPFALSGYATVLVWRNAIGRATGALEPNRALLHHRNVRVIDLFAARIFLELAATTTSFIVLYGLLVVLDLAPWPADVLTVLIGWCALCGLSASLAVLIGALATMNETVDRFWHVFSYLFLPASGAFTIVAVLPMKLQSLALWVPTVHCVEMIRQGIFGLPYHGHFDLSYVVMSCMIVLAPGLLLVRLEQSRVEGE
jgi:capsular polysaccharide transport system permease protein